MKRVLLTAFEPYGDYPENASLKCLEHLLAAADFPVALTDRVYPVRFAEVRQLLADDLSTDYDYAVFLGQAPGAEKICLEAIGLNVGGEPHDPPEDYGPLETDGPLAYRSGLPLQAWSKAVAAAELPAQVSYHAGTYLCNATLYWALHLIETVPLSTQATFVHLPLFPDQQVPGDKRHPRLATQACAQAVRLMLEQMAAT